MHKDIEVLFPDGKVLSQEMEKEGAYLLPLSDTKWFQVEEARLTPRERALLGLLGQKVGQAGDNPWYRYLVANQGERPQSAQAFQFIHIHLWSFPEQEVRENWLAMMRGLLPQMLGECQLGQQDYLFILEQEPLFPVEALLRDTLSALEFDFGLRLTICIGSIWSQVEGAWSALFQAEQGLFASWLVLHQSSQVLSFAQLYLWGQGRKEIDLTAPREQLRQMIASQDQLADSIQALWEEGAVVTKAAQRLYIHRNTLQYRLEKWQELTGLNLRNLTDLALCYQVVLAD